MLLQTAFPTQSSDHMDFRELKLSAAKWKQEAPLVDKKGKGKYSDSLQAVIMKLFPMNYMRSWVNCYRQCYGERTMEFAHIIKYFFLPRSVQAANLKTSDADGKKAKSLAKRLKLASDSLFH